ncbi:T9SS type A sorting domain-containing protein [bacterium]|nr:T9SS type A sorting domain-containing protein [bacterium]
MKRTIMAVCFVVFVSAAAIAQNPFGISLLNVHEETPATAYNFQEDEFLIVWQSTGHKIHGRILNGDGTPRTDTLVIFAGGTSNLLPDVAYNRINNEYMIVWEDWRRELGADGPDIFGIRVDKDGRKLHSPRSEADTSFIICDNDSSQGHAKIAHNYKNNIYMTVWHDNRHNYRNGTAEWAIYGQRLAWNADLMSPLSTPDTKENQMVGKDMDYRDKSPDIAYHGGIDGEFNEFMVVWQRFLSMDMMNNCRVWAARVKGSNGMMLDSYGVEYEPGNASMKASGGPPWWEDMPVSVDDDGFWGTEAEYVDGSPHIWSNDYWSGGLGKAAAAARYPVPEFMVSWTSFKNGSANPDIMVQRMAFFPDSAAYRIGIKNQYNGSQLLGPDSNWVCVPLDTAGRWADPPWEWINWDHYAASNNTEYQSWNDLSFNQEAEEFLVVWNDWRENGHSGYPYPPADIYGQHLHIDPVDSSLKWTDPQGNFGHDKAVNTPIATVAPDDEGGGWTRYPCIAHGIVENAFFVGYGNDINNDGTSIGIFGVMHSGAIPTTVEDEFIDLPDEYVMVDSYPNPFNPTTTIRCRLVRRARVNISIYDVRGRLIEELESGVLDAGVSLFSWQAGQSPSGLYFCVVKSERHVAVSKMVLMR